MVRRPGLVCERSGRARQPGAPARALARRSDTIVISDEQIARAIAIAAVSGYPVTGGGAGGRETGRRTLTVVLSFPIGTRAGGVPPPAGVPPPGIPGGSPGI